MNTDGLELNEYYEKKHKENNELLECYFWLIVLTLLIGFVFLILWLIEQFMS